MSQRIIYLDGNYVREEEAKISVFDHGVLYGDGVFEVIMDVFLNVRNILIDCTMQLKLLC